MHEAVESGIMNRRDLESWITVTLTGHGFRLGRYGWYLPGADWLVMVSLDQSPYGGQYYITLAASPRDLIDGSEPREHQFHFRVRMESLVPDATDLLSALDLEGTGLPPEGRRRIITDALITHGLPLLLSLRTPKGLAHAMESHPRAAAFMIRTMLRDPLRQARGRIE